ncbi:MAG: NADH-quinone oxidoreductase subunit C [Cytophagia bacterium]|nr:NADH-quinone oxidoreductase subunit C [Cytophagia bacterium]
MDETLVESLASLTGQKLVLNKTTTPFSIEVSSDKILAVCEALHKNPSCYFDMLSCITALDNGKEANTMEVIYNLYSIPFNHHLMLKVILPREKPEIDSVISVWRTADWQEREAFDMYGIVFKGHPDLRRILMPADWEGYPLRKDYQAQEEYKGVTVKYEDRA